MPLSFEDYVKSLGAEQASIPYKQAPVVHGTKQYGDDYLRVSGAEGGGNQYQLGQNYYNDSNVSGMRDPNYQIGEQLQNTQNYSRPGYVDRDGGFLGMGSSFGDLRSNPNLNSQYSAAVSAQPEFEAQRLANLAELQKQAEDRRLANQQYLNSLPSVGAPAGAASQLTGTPQGFGGFGGAMPGFTAPPGQQQGLLTGALHRGKSGGTGLLGGGGQ
jgi:hypothetical protein